MPFQTVKLTIDHRNDGRMTVTIELVAWSPKELRHLTGSLWHFPDARTIGRALSDRLDGLQSSGPRRRP